MRHAVRHYRISGLLIETDLDLPFADRASAAEADVVIRQGAVPDALPSRTAAGPFWIIDGDRFLLTVPGVVRCLVTGGRAIAVDPARGVPLEDVVPFVMGTAFGVLLHQRGLLVLHGSSVLVGDQAMIFCGPSGAGKSTIAAALAQRGLPLISDDVCIVDFTPEGAPVVRPDGRLLRLWGRVVERLDLEPRRRSALRGTLKKYYVEPERAATLPQAAVGAVYRLHHARAAEPVGIVRANSVDAMIALRRSAYRPRYVAATGQQQRQFGDVARMASRVGVFELRRPFSFDAVPATIASLEAHWRTLGATTTPA